VHKFERPSGQRTHPPDFLAAQLFTEKSTYSQLKKEISRAYWVRPEGGIPPARPKAAG